VKENITVSDAIVSQWVSAAINGDQEAFAELLYTFQDAVYNLCYRLLGERTEAEPEPEQALLGNERSQHIQSLLHTLQPDYRAAVVLRYWYDYSYAEIAEILGDTESAIKSRLYRARQLLAEKMTPTSDEDLHNSLEERM